MPGKGARRHFSQLKEFERSLIIGMKTAGWSTHRVAGHVDGSECTVRNCWEQWTREVTRSTIRADVGVAIVPQTISRYLAEANLKSKRPFRALPLTPEHRQLRLQWCQARSMWDVTDWQKVVFSDAFWFVWGQMITVYGCGGALQDNARPHTAIVALKFPTLFSDSSMARPHPRLVPCRARVDQLKRQMPSCHSVHDLGLAV
ncbi:transposable element Tcb2 transposase [Trichonephila clavipes]|nr:transposable element Tcb2 transposase [Trichonephila clavipes]